MHDYLRLGLPDDELQRALRSWGWLGIDGLAPRAATMFGDLILEGRGGWWFLSTLEGTLTRPWDSQHQCEAQLSSEEGLQDYLGAGLVDLARAADLTLPSGEVIGFAVPPLLGGGFELDNLRPTSFLVVHLLMSRLHDQIRTTPPRAPFAAAAGAVDLPTSHGLEGRGMREAVVDAPVGHGA
jgi:hypothetical protein